jgi:hypothetical protein
MTKDEQAELSRSVAKFLSPPKPAMEVPLPAGVDRAKLTTDAALDKASSEYIRGIMRRPLHTWSAEDRAAVNQGINLALKEGW